jgi:hypothetical protein
MQCGHYMCITMRCAQMDREAAALAGNAQITVWTHRASFGRRRMTAPPHGSRRPGQGRRHYGDNAQKDSRIAWQRCSAVTLCDGRLLVKSRQPLRCMAVLGRRSGKDRRLTMATAPQLAKTVALLPHRAAPAVQRAEVSLTGSCRRKWHEMARTAHWMSGSAPWQRQCSGLS